MTFTLVEAAEIPAVGGMQRFTVPVSGGTLHVISTRMPDGSGRSLSSAFQPSAISAGEVNTSITTAGAGTLTAAAIIGGVTTRSGPTAVYTDTTDTAALIQAAWPGGAVGSSLEVTIKNTVPFAATLAGGTGVTLAGQTVIPALCVGRFLIVWTGVSALTMTGLSVGALTSLPNAKYGTLNATTGSLAAGALTGARSVYLLSTNATPGAQLVRTAAQMLADLPNGQVGQTWTARVLNSGAGVFTLTTDAGSTVTMTGTMTVAQNTWRDFMISIDTATTATVQALGAGTL